MTTLMSEDTAASTCIKLWKAALRNLEKANTDSNRGWYLVTFEPDEDNRDALALIQQIEMQLAQMGQMTQLVESLQSGRNVHSSHLTYSYIDAGIEKLPMRQQQCQLPYAIREVQFSRRVLHLKCKGMHADLMALISSKETMPLPSIGAMLVQATFSSLLAKIAKLQKVTLERWWQDGQRQAKCCEDFNELVDVLESVELEDEGVRDECTSLCALRSGTDTEGKPLELDVFKSHLDSLRSRSGNGTLAPSLLTFNEGKAQVAEWEKQIKRLAADQLAVAAWQSILSLYESVKGGTTVTLSDEGKWEVPPEWLQSFTSLREKVLEISSTCSSSFMQERQGSLNEILQAGDANIRAAVAVFEEKYRLCVGKLFGSFAEETLGEGSAEVHLPFLVAISREGLWEDALLVVGHSVVYSQVPGSSSKTIVEQRTRELPEQSAFVRTLKLVLTMDPSKVQSAERLEKALQLVEQLDVDKPGRLFADFSRCCFPGASEETYRQQYLEVVNQFRKKLLLKVIEMTGLATMETLSTCSGGTEWNSELLGRIVYLDGKGGRAQLSKAKLKNNELEAFRGVLTACDNRFKELLVLRDYFNSTPFQIWELC